MIYKESQEQQKLIRMFDNAQKVGAINKTYWLYRNHQTHKLSMVQQSIAKAEGMRKGVSDLFLAVPMNNFCGLFIEMKKPELKPKRANSKGGVSDEQAKFIKDMNNIGYKAIVCYGADDAFKQILSYLVKEY